MTTNRADEEIPESPQKDGQKAECHPSRNHCKKYEENTGGKCKF